MKSSKSHFLLFCLMYIVVAYIYILACFISSTRKYDSVTTYDRDQRCPYMLHVCIVFYQKNPLIHLRAVRTLVRLLGSPVQVLHRWPLVIFISDRQIAWTRLTVHRTGQLTDPMRTDKDLIMIWLYKNGWYLRTWLNVCTIKRSALESIGQRSKVSTFFI